MNCIFHDHFDEEVTSLNSKLTPQIGPMTINYDIIKSVGNANFTKCRVVGGVCFVQLYGIKFKNDGSNQTGGVSGLPKAAVQASAIIGGSGAADTAAIAAAGTGAWINEGSGLLNFHVGSGDANRDHWVYISYPVSES